MNEPPFYYLDSVRLNHKNENELLDGPGIHGPKSWTRTSEIFEKADQGGPRINKIFKTRTVDPSDGP